MKVALAALLVGFFLLMLDTTIVVVAMPTLSTQLHADVSGTTWVTSIYLLTFTVPLLLAGRLGDRYGTKRIYLIGLAVFTAASLACGLAGSIEALIAARGAQGLGAALMSPQTMATIGKLVPFERRARAMAYSGMVSGAAMLIGPVTGGFLVDAFGWQSIFLINVPIGIAGFAVAAKFVPVTERNRHRFDVLGMLLSGASLFCLAFGLEEAPAYNWGTITDDLTVLGSATGIAVTVPRVLAAGVVTGVLFVVWQAVNRSEPMVPLQIFRSRTFAVANVATLIAGFSLTAATLPGTLYFQAGRGMSPRDAALMTLPSALVSVPMGPFVGRIVERFGSKLPATLGLTIFSAALIIRSFLMTPSSPIILLLLQAAMMGAGSVLMMSPLAVAAMQSAPRPLIGAASGTFNTSRQIGSTLGSACAATLLATALKNEFTAKLAGLPAEERAQIGQPKFDELTAHGTAQQQSLIHEVASSAMAHITLWPAATLAAGAVIVVLLLKNPSNKAAKPAPVPSDAAPVSTDRSPAGAAIR
ncbi:DHA2 family efflux MFS transporter permease subunit [Flexivirga sp. ID2601S]|uniref:DHA2 family efflux MFS transporter permease subunit n=1 Tax=Flexivirga aerilata TaxID=1656889 RepID=A0A849AI55_9MICO|nr:DHA2 family efflux MFS transporter permease subunit [Flexivirga aerilata]